MTTSKKTSPALQLVRLVYLEGQKATGHSWTRLNQALYQAAKVAIEGGLLFYLDDFTAFHTETRASYWIGAHPDGLYAAACKAGNESACRAYEAHYGFLPYELDGHRIYVGHNFMWHGERVTCTSVQKDRVVACSYQYESDSHRRQKILRRYSITPSQMEAERKAREAAIAGAKMQTARDAARKLAHGERIPDQVLTLAIEDVRSGLSDNEQKQLAEITAKRFKKSDRPTVLDLLTVGQRWSGDFSMATRLAIQIAQKVKTSGDT